MRFTLLALSLMLTTGSLTPVTTLTTFTTLPALVTGPAGAVLSDPDTGDWPMWGGTPDRNMVSHMKGLPTEWDIKSKKNVKWVAELGSQSYGNPVVSGGVVLVGTNNEGLRDPKQPGDRACSWRSRNRMAPFCGSRHTRSCRPAGRTTGPIKAWRLHRWSRATACTT
jgi:hypothetical protein